VTDLSKQKIHGEPRSGLFAFHLLGPKNFCQARVLCSEVALVYPPLEDIFRGYRHVSKVPRSGH
jgi:hypothetical protein